MNEQPKALRLARYMEISFTCGPEEREAAAELRRLHEENERLKEQQQHGQRPVAWMHTNAIGHVYFRKNPQDKTLNPVPLYTSPPAGKPLTAEQEVEEFEAWCYSVGLMQKSHGIVSISSQSDIAWKAWQARAAHGIKEDA